MAEGGVPVIRVVIVTLVVALLLGVVCAVSLGLSALLARGTTSSVLAYLSVFALTVGTLVLFGLATAASESSRQVNGGGPGAPAGCCQYQQNVVHTDETWWLLAPNPFVVLADAAPVIVAEAADCQTVEATSGPVRLCAYPEQSNVDPLGDISRSVRSLREPPSESLGGLSLQAPGRGGLVWPYGLGFDVALGAFMFWVATRRLRTPRQNLPRGVRLA
jgi:hypothetical protein